MNRTLGGYAPSKVVPDATPLECHEARKMINMRRWIERLRISQLKEQGADNDIVGSQMKVGKQLLRGARDMLKLHCEMQYCDARTQDTRDRDDLIQVREYKEVLRPMTEKMSAAFKVAHEWLESDGKRPGKPGTMNNLMRNRSADPGEQGSVELRGTVAVDTGVDVRGSNGMPERGLFFVGANKGDNWVNELARHLDGEEEYDSLSTQTGGNEEEIANLDSRFAKGGLFEYKIFTPERTPADQEPPDDDTPPATDEKNP